MRRERLQKAQNWLARLQKKKSVTPSKSNLFILHPFQHKLDNEVNENYFDKNFKQLVTLQRKTYVINFSWKYHIDYISSII